MLGMIAWRRPRHGSCATMNRVPTTSLAGAASAPRMWHDRALVNANPSSNSGLEPWSRRVRRARHVLKTERAVEKEGIGTMVDDTNRRHLEHTTSFGKTRKHVVAAGLVMGCVAVLGCSAQSRLVPTNAVSGMSVDDDVTDDLNAFHRHHHQGGVIMFVALSLDTLGLPRDQDAVVRGIQERLFLKMEPARVAEQELLNALADGMASGAVDKARSDAAVAHFGSASGLVSDAAASSLNDLHAALTPPQRGALVDKVLAHWTVFQQAERSAGVGFSTAAGHLAELAEELGLSAGQVERITASLSSTEPAVSTPAESARVEAHRARLAGFREAAFDARTLTDGAAVCAYIASRGAARMVWFYEAVAPQITPDQRPKLALLLRDHATHTESARVATQGGSE